jgi:hypothetical protein
MIAGRQRRDRPLAAVRASTPVSRAPPRHPQHHEHPDSHDHGQRKEALQHFDQDGDRGREPDRQPGPYLKDCLHPSAS